MTGGHVYIVDDDEAVRNALTLLLITAGYSVLTFAGAGDFLAACELGWRGCLILDMLMPPQDGLSLQDELYRRGMRMPIIFLSARGDIPLAVKAIKRGAVDFLTKPVDGPLLIATIQEALALEQAEEHGADPVARRLETLTDREREIMTYLLDGLTSKAVAQRLGISHRTVEIHRSRILYKAGASNLVELVRLVELRRVPR
jgi:FixJ family two-component response regulator